MIGRVSPWVGCRARRVSDAGLWRPAIRLMDNE